MSWEQICSRLSAFPSVDIIIITASAETRLLQEALRSGVSHYVIKPVSAHKFTEVLLKYREKRMAALTAGAEPVRDRHVFRKRSERTKQHNDLPTGINSITLQKSKRAQGTKRDDG